MHKKANDLFEQLCQTFRIKPGIVWHRKSENSEFDSEDLILKISMKPWQGWKFAIVHEFSHALDTIRNGDRLRNHDKLYYDTLVEVIGKSYRTPKQYKWHCEYNLIRLWAFKDGYTKIVPDCEEENGRRKGSRKLEPR